MPMSIFETLMYLCIVVVVHGWPIILALLIVGFIVKHPVKVAIGVILGIPLTAGIMFLYYQNDRVSQRREFNRREIVLREVFGPMYDTETFSGAFTGGTEKDGYHFLRYQVYGMLENNSTGCVELLIPQTEYHNNAGLSVVDAPHEELEPAWFIRLPGVGSVQSPDDPPAHFVNEKYPDVPAEIALQHIVIFYTYVAGGLIWYPDPDDISRWKGHRLTIDFSTLNGPS